MPTLERADECRSWALFGLTMCVFAAESCCHGVPSIRRACVYAHFMRVEHRVPPSTADAVTYGASRWTTTRLVSFERHEVAQKKPEEPYWVPPAVLFAKSWM